MKQATYEQDHEHIAQYSGATISYRAGIDLTVSWEPGHATAAREQLARAFTELDAQIRDAEEGQ